jgi:hypothetical protein
MTAPRLVVGALALVASLAFPASSARADYSKAWAAAKDNLPATTKAVFVGDVALGVKTATYAAILPLLLAEERDVEQGLALIKGTCKIDAVSAVDGFVVAGDPIAEQGVVFLQVAGVDRTKVSSCIQSVLKLVGEKVATVTQDGMFTVISNGRDSMYLAWVTPQVVAISIEPEKKAQLQAWVGQKGAFARSPLSVQLAKVDTKAPSFGALALDKPLDDDDIPVKLARGTLHITGGVLTGELWGNFATPADAKRVHAEMTKEMTREMGRKTTPPAIKKAMKTIAVKTTGSDVTLKIKITEKDLIAAISAAAK